MIENKDIAPGAVTEPKLSKNLRLKLANLEKGQSAQLPIVQSDGSMAYKAIGGDATLADDGTLTVTTTTTTTGETVQGPAGPAGVAGPAGATGAQGATGPAGSDASVTAENVDGALGFTGSTAGFVKRTGDNAFDIDTTVYESAFSKNTAFNKNFGTAAGTVCQGNDGRLSDSRTPTTHASTHATGGSDAIAPSDIGAEPAFTKNTAHNKNFGSTAGTVCEGNDSRLSDARTPVSHNHAASEITSGTLHNDRIAESNVTQHQAAIDHDQLTNFSADEHRVIDDSSTSDQDKLWSAYNITTNLALYTPLSTYSGHGHGQYAVKANNLSDLTNAGTARTNLGLGTAAESATGDFAAASHNHDHDALTNFVANEHIDWTTDQGATNIHTGNYNNTEYTAGSGLSLVGTVFSYDNSVIASQVDLSNTSALHLSISNNLSDLNNAGTARSNLGLGSAAQSATTDFASSGHTHSAATTSANGFMSSTDKTKLDAYPSTNATHNNEFLRKDGTFTSTPSGIGTYTTAIQMDTDLTDQHYTITHNLGTQNVIVTVQRYIAGTYTRAQRFSGVSGVDGGRPHGTHLDMGHDVEYGSFDSNGAISNNHVSLDFTVWMNTAGIYGGDDGLWVYVTVIG